MSKLRCYAHGRPGAWEAICIDLDLSTSGPSFEAVMASLKEAIDLYVECAMQEAETDRQRLLERRAPLHLRLRHLISFYLSRVWDDQQDDELRAGFQLNSPA